MSSSNPFAVLATLDDDDDEREEKQSTFTFAPSVLGPVEGRLGGGGAGGGAGARSVTAAAAPFALAAAAPTLPAGGAGHGTFTDLVKQHAQSSPLPLAGPTNAPPPTPEPASPATQARLAPPVAFDAALLSQACSQISVPSRTSDKSWDFAGLAHDVSKPHAVCACTLLRSSPPKLTAARLWCDDAHSLRWRDNGWQMP